MASNVSLDNYENHHSRFQKRRSRSRSSHSSRSNKELNKALSVGDFEKAKILNIESNYEIFLSVSQAFENILNQLEIDDNFERVHKKLVEIEKLVKEKISFFEPNITKKNKTLTSSVLSLNSEDSGFDNCVDDSFLKEFMIKVTCPFCSKSQADKVSLIKHLDNDCTPHKYEIIEKSNHFPFSTFQILPNDAFKCNVCPNSVLRNLTKYVTHLHTSSHTSAYAKAVQTKYYSELLFCSCCKVQIPNNYTQIDFHIRHEAHKTRSDSVPNLENYLRKGIDCVFCKSKKFKCLSCPSHQSVHDTSKDLLNHFEQPSHIKSIKKNSNNSLILYCEYCCTKVHVFEIISHFKQKEHKKKVEEEVLENRYELCFFCGFMCYDLMSLSNHMKSKCPGINEIREKNLKSVEKNLKLNEKEQQKEKIDEKKEENFIVVKDAMEIQKLFKFFRKFGEITEIGTLNEKDVKIKFLEKETVDDILLLRNVLKIDGLNLKISTDENLCKSEEKINQAIKNVKSPNGNGEVDVSYTGHGRYESSKTETDHSDGVTEDSEIEKLFLRVSSHLANNAEKLDSESQKKIIHDCMATLEFQQCDVVGFSGCGLSFPVEGISLYCDLEKRSVKDLGEFSSVKETDNFENVLYSTYIKMCESHLWKNVNVSFDGIFRLIKCEHKETEKACTINFAPSIMILTNMLRDCLESSEVVRSFCLIIRFWLSVHELKIREYEYTVISILVYFLISERVVNFPLEKYQVPKISVLEKALKGKFGIVQKPSGWRIYELDIKKLFQSFSLFLSKFDFDKNAICLPIQRPVPKTLFTMAGIKLIFNFSDSERALKSPVCILDPCLNKNLGENVKKEDIKSLLKIVNSTITHYKIQ